MGFWTWLSGKLNGGKERGGLVSPCLLGDHDLPCPTYFDVPGGRQVTACARCGKEFITVDSRGDACSQPHMILWPGAEQRWWVDKDKYYQRCRQEGEAERAAFRDRRNWYKDV